MGLFAALRQGRQAVERYNRMPRYERDIAADLATQRYGPSYRGWRKPVMHEVVAIQIGQGLGRDALSGAERSATAAASSLGNSPRCDLAVILGDDILYQVIVVS